MALKPSDVLDRLPSASELLEKPPIRALADRWNRSVVCVRRAVISRRTAKRLGTPVGGLAFAVAA